MKRKGMTGLTAAAAAALAGLALMLGLFAARENSYRPIETLPPYAAQAEGPSAPPAENRVNVNTAGLEELDTLPGIGPVKAAAIIAWREENGPFRYPEQLLEVAGIGEKTLEGLMDLVTTGDD